MDASLLDRIKDLINSEKLELPAVNSVAMRLQSMAADQDFDIVEAERLILSDQALAAEVLRAANSAFFGGLAPINTIKAAVVRLSISQVARLIFTVSERAKYCADDPAIHANLLKLWLHSKTTAKGAQWLARRLNFKNLEDEAFLGGLLHDVGQLVILRALDVIKHSDEAPVDVSSNLVQEVLACAHADLGYELLKRWNIPEVYCRIARDHHRDGYDTSDLVLAIVRLANMAECKLGLSLRPDHTLVLSDLAEAQQLGASDILLAELEIMLEDSAGEPADSTGFDRCSTP